MPSSVRQDPNAYLNEQAKDLESRIRAIEESAPGDVIAETIQLGDPTSVPTEVGSIIAAGDISTVPWTDYSALSTIVGWSSFANKLINYKVVGKLVFLQFFLGGESNSTSTNFTVPYICEPYGDITVITRILDDDTYAVGMVRITQNTAIVDAYPSFAGGTWTNSGGKAVLGQLWYPVE